MTKRFGPFLLCLSVLLAIAAPALAVKPKPLAYGYGQCKSKTSCQFNAITNVKGTTIQVQVEQGCVLIAQAVAAAGQVKVGPSGKFSISKTYSSIDPADQKQHSITVNVVGKLTKLKKVTGTLKSTSDAPGCSADTGKTVQMHMKYRGPIYGG